MKKRKTKYFPFEHVRNLIRAEQIGSVAMYEKWYQHNKPNGIPKRPDIIYAKKGWISWNDFLGNCNKFKHTKKTYVSYEEARKWARTLGLKTYEQWIAYVKDGNKPANIPARPDYYYKEWFTWKEFLGADVKQLVKEVAGIKPILYILKFNNMPANVYKIDVTNGGKEEIINLVKQGGRVIAAFEYTVNLDWRNILSKYGNNYWNGDQNDYSFSNINPFIFEIASRLSPFKF